jgi:hypothetical protein
VLNLFVVHLLYFKLKWQGIFHAAEVYSLILFLLYSFTVEFVEIENQLVAIETFSDLIAQNDFLYKPVNKLTALDLFDLIPDKTLATYGGKRFRKSEVDLDVCLPFAIVLGSHFANSPLGPLQIQSFRQRFVRCCLRRPGESSFPT